MNPVRLLRLLGIGTAIVTAALALTSQTGATAATSIPAVSYYLALGDSLAQGYQPGLGTTDQGYTDDLYQVLKLRDPGLRLVKIGCVGETTTTMLDGGECSYGSYPSQLAAADAFLAAHQGQVAYVTINIGGNDLDACATAAGINASCVTAAIQTVAVNVPKILASLRAAGGAGPVYAGNGTYDPLLAGWLAGTAGQAQAQESVQVADAFNSLEAADYQAAGFLVANSNAVWQTDDFTATVTVPSYGTVPLNVAEICTFTYMCSQQNIHPNAGGYALIAWAFLQAIFPHDQANPLASQIKLPAAAAAVRRAGAQSGRPADASARHRSLSTGFSDPARGWSPHDRPGG
jgi:lysophospholipase L1-like esterase